MNVLLVTTCWWPAFARLAQLLMETGCGVAVLCPPGHPARMLPGVTVFEQRPFSPLRALSRAILRFDPVFIIPGDERASHHMHRLHGHGSTRERELIEHSIGAPESYFDTVSRIGLLARARRLLISIPAGQAITGEGELAAWIAAMPAPSVLKLDGSWGGMGVIIVATRQAAFTAYRRLRRQTSAGRAVFRMIVNRDAYWLADCLRGRPTEVSVQSFIQGLPSDLSMFCWKGEVLAAVMGEAVISLGATRPTSIIRLINRPDMMDTARRLAGEMRLTGFYGLDFIIEAVTDRAYLLEMNPRPTSLTNIRMQPGRDLPGALATALSGTPCPPPTRLPEGTLVAYFPLAWQDGHPDATHPQAHLDVPWNEPALMAEMLQQRWPERQLLARLEQACRRAARSIARLPARFNRALRRS